MVSIERVYTPSSFYMKSVACKYIFFTIWAKLSQDQFFEVFNFSSFFQYSWNGRRRRLISTTSGFSDVTSVFGIWLGKFYRLRFLKKKIKEYFFLPSLTKIRFYICTASRNGCKTYSTKLVYNPFHKTLPITSLQIHWISVRFYEMGDIIHYSEHIFL